MKTLETENMTCPHCYHEHGTYLDNNTDKAEEVLSCNKCKENFYKVMFYYTTFSTFKNINEYRDYQNNSLD